MIVDVNVSLSRWPTRRLPLDEPAALVAKLRSAGVTQAWAGSLDALLHKDLASVNARLAAECKQHGPGMLLAMGAVNPTLPDWQDDVRRCADEHGMRGVRVHPDYHGYSLDDPRFIELLSLCDERGLVLQLAVLMEDERTQHPLLRVPPVDVRPLRKLLAERPRLRVVLLNALRSARLDDLAQMMTAGQLYVEIAALEGVQGVTKLLAQLPLERILFGSHSPFFVHDAAVLKLKESELAGIQRDAIEHGNAERLLEGKTT